MTDRGPFEVCRDPLVDEEVWLARTTRGLTIRVMPTDRFKETAAMVTFGYGSCDLGFRDGVRQHLTPEGMAHFLEHKLFEDEEILVFDRFARRGAKVNAFTGFTRTSYHFTATDRLQDNLQDLLALVSRAHITPENVDKERGIIAQEIRMYEDSPDYRLFFALLGRMYSTHPVRHPVGGTVESIQRITAAGLLDCFAAFYRTGNAALAVAGPVDPQQILALAEACPLAQGAATSAVQPHDRAPVQRARAEVACDVPRAKFSLGYKDDRLQADPEQRAVQQLVTEVLLDRLFSPASDLREDLQRRGLIDDSLAYSHLSEASFGFSTLSGDSEDPGRAIDALVAALETPVTLDAAYLERARKRLLSRYVRSFTSVRAMAHMQADEALEPLAPFGVLARLEAVTPEVVLARQRQHFRADCCAAVIGRP